MNMKNFWDDDGGAAALAGSLAGGIFLFFDVLNIRYASPIHPGTVRV